MEAQVVTITPENKKTGGIVDAHEQPKFHLIRIVEALIIGALCAGVTMWGTQLILGEKINQLAQTQTEFRIEVREEIRRIRDDFYVPRYMRNE